MEDGNMGRNSGRFWEEVVNELIGLFGNELRVEL